MKHYKSKWFNRWAKKNKLNDDDLYNAINNLIENKSTAKLGKYLYKVRVAQKKRGKSKSYRTIVIFITNVRSIFAYGFSKNERSNISKSELLDYKELAITYSKLTNKDIQNLLKQELFFEIEVQHGK